MMPPLPDDIQLVVARLTRTGGTPIFMEEINSLALIRILLARLERISADSYWAHRASGIRGSLLRVAEKLESHQPVSASELKRIMDLGFAILAKAAEELAA